MGIQQDSADSVLVDLKIPHSLLQMRDSHLENRGVRVYSDCFVEWNIPRIGVAIPDYVGNPRKVVVVLIMIGLRRIIS